MKVGNQTLANCNQLKTVAEDGKMRLTDKWDNQGVQQSVEYAFKDPLQSRLKKCTLFQTR